MLSGLSRYVSIMTAPLVLVVIIFFSQILSVQTPAFAGEKNSALLQGLDKVTGRVSMFSQKINKPTMFGTLEVTIRACHKKRPEEPPESSAFIEIRETNQESERQLVFTGWMFSSTPGLSSLEHPVYDIWVLDCINS